VNTANVDTLDEIGEVVRAAREDWGERGEAVLEWGLEYREGEPVKVRLRKRAHRYDLDDQGAAVRLAGRRAGWLEVCEHVVARQGLNVNRRGVVFVPAVEGRDLSSLALLVADTSVAVWSSLLELSERR
jgi:hypothetical protein